MQLPDKPFLIVVGGSARVVAQWAVTAGWQVFAVDRFGDVDTRRCGPWRQAPENWQELPGILQELPAGPVLFLGGLEHHLSVVQSVATRREVLGFFDAQRWQAAHQRPDRGRHIATATILEQLAIRAGLRIPESRLEPPPTRDRAWLWKEHDSAGGGGVRWSSGHVVASASDRYGAAKMAPTNGRWLKRLEGRPVGFSFIGQGHNEPPLFLSACPMLRPFVGRESQSLYYRGSVLVGDSHRDGLYTLSHLQQRLEVARPAVERLAAELCRDWDLRGWFGIDVMVDAEGQATFLEVNPRGCASMELWALVRETPQSIHEAGAALLTAHIAAVRGDRIDVARLTNMPVCHELAMKRIVYTKTALIVPESCDWQSQFCCGEHGRLADLPTPGTRIEAGWPVLTQLFLM